MFRGFVQMFRGFVQMFKGFVEMFKGWSKCSRVGSNVQGLVQMFKGWSKCSCVGGERSRVSKRLRGNAQKLYLKWSLTARRIAKVNAFVCSNFVLIISDDVLVREVRAYIVNKLFKLVHRFLCSCLYRQQIVQARTPLPFHIL